MTGVLYLGYISGAAVSGVWAYRDAEKRGRAHARSVALGTMVLFPIGLLVYVLSR
jgi:hypothetical protein